MTDLEQEMITLLEMAKETIDDLMKENKELKDALARNAK